MMADQKRLSWMKFYPADHQADEGLRQCSLAARGLWMELLSIMHKAEPCGHLLIAGVKPSLKQLSAAVGADLKATERAMGELSQWNVYSTTEDGVIVSRRMVRDAAKRAQDTSNGRKGGNPDLGRRGSNGSLRQDVAQREDIHQGQDLTHSDLGDSGGDDGSNNHPVIPPDNPGVNPPGKAQVNREDKAQRLEARDQRLEKEEPPSLRSGPQKRKSRLPEDWAPSKAGLTFAADRGADPSTESQKFRDHHTAKGSVMADWDAAWRTWCNNAQQFRRAPSAAKPSKLGWMAKDLGVGAGNEIEGGPIIDLPAGGWQ